VSRGALLATALLLAARVEALDPGGGPAATDCLAEFGGTTAGLRGRTLRCVDGDPSCDDDPRPGVCRFRLEVCLNVTDPALPGCAPAALEDYTVENPQPDTNPRHDFDLQNLEDELNVLTLPVDADTRDVCTGEVGMDVHLPVRFLPGGARWRPGRKIVRATVSGPGGVRDEDLRRFICVPPRGASACDGVSSTFDQIRRHIFTPTSCARSTCHNVAQEPHQLSLDPAEAWAALVGVPPTNAAAAAAGKLRVAPGDPARSFVLDKLRGTLASGEGARMPFGLDPLRPLPIALVEEWIAAGAPATGFVGTLGCPGP
jgi:hypothetical protein